MELVYYVIRQRGGWGVEYDGLCRAGRPTRDAALKLAREEAEREMRSGNPCRIRIQGDGGMWEEDRSFAGRDEPFAAKNDPRLA